MLDRNFERLSRILLLHNQRDLAVSPLQHIVQSLGGNFIASRHLVVIRFIFKRQRDHSLFLEIRFVDTRERFGEYDASTEKSRLQRRVFPGRSFTIVVFSDYEPRLVLGFPFLAELGDGVLCAVDVRDLVDFTCFGVHRSNEGVFGDVGEMTFVFEPGTGSGDGIGGTLSLHFDEDFQAREFAFGEGSKRFQKFEAGRVRIHCNGDVGVGDRFCGAEHGVSCREAERGEFRAFGWLEAEAFTRGGGEAVGHRVEVRSAGIRHCCYKVGRGEKVHGLTVSIVPGREITVV